MTSRLLRIPQWIAGKMPRAWIPALYRMGPISSLLRWTMNRIAPRGHSRVEVASGLLKGWFLELNLKTEKDMWLGSYEIRMQMAIERLAIPGMTAFDIGANIGYVSLMLAKCVGSTGRVYAFEPLPENQERLKTNLSLNAMAERVKVMPLAVGDHTGESSFLKHASGEMGKLAGSAGRSETYLSEIPIRVASLDDLVFDQGLPAPDLMKIDIEGGEVLALPGMARVLANARPIVFLEVHGPESATVIWEALSSQSYDLFQLEKNYPAVKSRDDLGWKAYLIAVPAERDSGLGQDAGDDRSS